MRKLLLTGALLSCILFSCGDDDTTAVVPEPITVEIEDFQGSISENPSDGQAIGTVKVTTNADALTFALTDISPEGAISIDAKTGALTVADIGIFDFETNTTITAKVTASADDVSDEGTITVTVTDILAPNATDVKQEDVSTTTLVGNKAFTIIGENFGEDASLVTAAIGSLELEIQSVSASSLTVSAPTGDDLVTGNLTITVQGETFTNSETSYDLIPSLVVTEVSSTSGFFGDEITITGKRLGASADLNMLSTSLVVYYRDNIGDEATAIQPTIVSATDLSITFEIPEGKVSSHIVLDNGLETYGFDFDIQYNVSFRSQSIERVADIVGTEISDLLIENTSKFAEDNVIKLTRWLDGKEFTIETLEVISTVNPSQSNLRFKLPDEIGLYKVEVTVGDQVADGDYSVSVYQNISIGSITSNTFGFENGKVTATVIADPALKFFTDGSILFVEFYDADTKEKLYEQRADRGFGSNNRQYGAIIDNYVGPSGSTYRVRVRKELGEEISYTPISMRTMVLHL